jgi:hypothetical protein
MAAGVTGTFSGKTSEGKRVRLIVSHGVIQHGSKIPYVMLCQHGTLSGTLEPYGRVRRGHFAVSIHGTESLGHGYRARHRASLKITFGSGHMLGLVKEQATVLKSSGAVFEHCYATVGFAGRR